MNRIFLLVGLIVATAIVGIVLFLNRGARVRLTGDIQKVRNHILDENATLVVADFRVTNPSSVPFVVRSVDVILERADGAASEGSTISEIDAKRVFEHAPEIGQRFNSSLIAREQIRPQETMDRMIAARFELPLAKVENSQTLRLRITDVDGAVSEIITSPRAPR